MPTDIIMPQMGESIVEGTITKWLKKPGDKIQRDEPLFEISTDKVDAEIPAPASGVLQEIKVSEGSTVGVNTVVGTISVDGEAATAPAKSAPTASALAPEAKPPEKKEEKRAASASAPVAGATPVPQPAEDGAEEARSSPLVRKIAREHGVNLSQVSGTGLGGRITKQDIMAFIERPASSPAAAAEPASQPAP
ncbi:MAG: biotin/lipoyl-containing protein, partial [Candidatus Sulfotelmatobacter sp.]